MVKTDHFVMIGGGEIIGWFAILRDITGFTIDFAVNENGPDARNASN